MAKVFFSYSHDDEHYRDQLEKHLALLKREGLIESWHDRRIRAGSPVDQEIDEQLVQADIVLLLVSASFLASDYCYGKELQRAMERHETGEAVVVPVIVRPCDWKSSPFGKLLAAPRDGKPVTTWPNYDEAYTDIARRVRELVDAKSPGKPRLAQGRTQRQSAPTTSSTKLPRSSNMRLRRSFTDAERDAFLHNAFEYMVTFFEGSLQELQSRHRDIECRFRRIDANCFTAFVFRDGKRQAECAINLGGGFRRGGITFSNDASSRGNSFNEELSVDNDDQALFLKPLGMASYGNAEAKFSAEQGAEHFWSLLIASLQ
jgi:hypothetical protein